MEGVWLAVAVILQLYSVFVSGQEDLYLEPARKLTVPKFLPTTTNFQYHVGDTAVLECAVENLGEKQVSWRKVSSEKVLTIGTASFVSDSRIEVEHPPGSSLWNLIIRDLKSSDAGVYECQVSAKVRHLRHHVTLLVTDPPVKPAKKPNIQITGANFVDEGKRLYLTCNATATEQPPEDLDWFREGNRLQTSQQKGVYIRKFVTLSTSTIVSTLEIKQARLSDAGVYVCRTSSLDVTSFRVNVLNGDKNNNNVKRAGSVVVQGPTVIPESTTKPTTETTGGEDEDETVAFLTSVVTEDASSGDNPGTVPDHTEESAPHSSSASALPELRHACVTSVLLSGLAVAVLTKHLLLLQIT